MTAHNCEQTCDLIGINGMTIREGSWMQNFKHSSVLRHT